MQESQAPTNPTDAPKRRRSAPFTKRIALWWHNSSVYALFWRFGNALYNWWYPREPDAYGGYYGRRRISRPRRAWRRFQAGLGNSFLGKAWAHLTHRLHGWWFPQSTGGAAHFDDGRVPRNFLSRQFLFCLDRVRTSGIVSFLSRWWHGFYEWWYPAAPALNNYPGYSGRRRVGRLALAWHRFVHLMRRSFLGRGYAHLAYHLYEWWYPAVTVSAYAGYSGRRRLSRPALLLQRALAGVRASFLGRWYASLAHHLYDWWYPPPTAEDLAGSGYQYRRASRPVLILRRLNRWFRKTWLGREFGWLVDEVLHVSYSLRERIIGDFDWESLQRFLVRPGTIVCGLMLLGVLALGYHYGLPKYRRYMERQYAAQARGFFERGDLMRANLRARQALGYNQDNPEATWVHAEIADRVRSPQALYWRQRAVFAAPFASNRLALAAAALRSEEMPFPTAARALAEIAPADTNAVNYQMIAGALAIRLSNLPAAQEHFQAALQLEPDNAAARMSLAVVRLQSNDPEAVKDSRTTLGLLSSEGKLGILPLRSLVAESFGRRDYDAAESISSQILTNSQASFSDSMLHLSILKAAGRTNFSDFLQHLRNSATNQPAWIGELAAWMNQSGYAAEARDWLAGVAERFPNQPMLRLALADSYVALKQWAELQEFAEGNRWQGLEHVRLAMVSYAVRQQGVRNKLVWDRALSVASSSPAALNTLARMAENWGWLPETEETLWEAFEKFPNTSWPSLSLHRLLLAKNDAAGFRRLFQAQARNNPKDPLARNNYAILSLLLGKDVEAACLEAQRLYAASPTNATFASTFAFALHLQGKTREGIEVLRTLQPEALAEPSVAVYYGILLAAAGEKQLAKTYLDKSEHAFLLPPERSLLDVARKSL